MKRGVWLVDNNYVMSSVDFRIDLKKLKDFLQVETESRITCGYLVDSTKDNQADFDRFLNWVRCAEPYGPGLRLKVFPSGEMPCTCPECGHQFSRRVQKRVDVAIATLIVKLAAEDRYDALILSSGDGDFEEAIKYAVEEKGKELYLVGAPGTISPLLQCYSQKVIWLPEYKKVLEKDS